MHEEGVMKAAVVNQRAGHCSRDGRTVGVLELLGARTTMTARGSTVTFSQCGQFTGQIEQLHRTSDIPLLLAIGLVDTVHNHQVEVSVSLSWLAPRMSSCQAAASGLAATCNVVGTYHCLLPWLETPTGL